MVAGFTALVLIVYNGMIDRPAPEDGIEFGTSLDFGYLGRADLLDRDRRHRIPALAGGPEARAKSPRHRLTPGSSLAGHVSDLARRALRPKPDRNLALELVRVTEAAALAAARWVGRGEKESADGAAVDAMRLLLDTVPMDGIVVIGEGEKDEAPMLFNGEKIGDGSPPEVDIAVDPLEGTRLCGPRHALGPGRDRALRAGDDVRPRAVRLHGEARGRPRDRRPAEPRRAAHGRDRAGSPSARGPIPATSP